MPHLDEVSPFVRGILEENHFEPVRLLRYGPRFVCMVVRSGEREGLFKMVLPESERNEKNTPEGYVWTEYDKVGELERRLLKEALFLQFFSQQLDNAGFEPQIIALSEQSPVWSLRTYITERTMSAWDSNFVFSPRFFQLVSPRQAVDFFHRLHQLSPQLPHSLAELISEFGSTLTNSSRFERSVERAEMLPEFAPKAKALALKFAELEPRYQQYDKVICQYEPYSCHIFMVNDKMSLIDWENVGWGHPLQDLSVLWMRCFDDPEWQAEYLKVMEEYGYFEGSGRLFWESELMIQSFANHLYFSEGGPIGSPEYDKRAIAFFEATLRNIFETSADFRL